MGSNDNWWESQEYLESLLREMMDAINSEPGWHAEGPSISHGQVSVLARHNDEEGARVIRSLGEWRSELRTHQCDAGTARSGDDGTDK